MFFFNGISMVKRKTQLAIQEGLGGVMVWEVGQDTGPNEESSLLAAIGDMVKGSTKGNKDEL